MKKALALFLALAMTISLSVMSAAALGKEGKDSVKDSVADTVTKVKNSAQEEKDKAKEAAQKTINEAVKETKETAKDLKQETPKLQELKNQFKSELNQTKKELQKQKATLDKNMEALQAEYKKLVDAGDKTAAEAVLQKINALKTEMNGLKEKVKQTINERYMVVKTMYSAEEFAQFKQASELISKMYADASTLQAGSVTINNNIIKFDAPPYIKGGSTLVPIRAITEGLGAEVSWDAATQTAKITKNDTVIEIKANSTTVLVNGKAVEIPAPAKINSGRVYVPLRFIAETLKLNVAWDSENQIIDIDNGTTDTNTSGGQTQTTTDTTSTGTASTGTASTGTASTGTTSTGTTSTGTTSTGTTSTGTTSTGTTSTTPAI